MSIDEKTVEAYKFMRKLGMKPGEILQYKRMLDTYRDNGVSAPELAEAIVNSGAVVKNGNNLSVDLSVLGEGAQVYQPNTHLGEFVSAIADQKKPGYDASKDGADINDQELSTAGKIAVYGLVGLMAVGAGGLAVKALSGTPAYATPIMSVDFESSISSDYDLSHLGDELLVQYLVSNISDLLGENNMIQFTLPAGSNQGVYNAGFAPELSGWNFTINLDNTVFSGNGNSIAPGSQGLFELYSTDLNIHQDNATALATGIGNNIPFDPVQVDVPGQVPEPATIAILGLGLVRLLTKNRKAK